MGPVQVLKDRGALVRVRGGESAFCAFWLVVLFATLVTHKIHAKHPSPAPDTSQNGASPISSPPISALSESPAIRPETGAWIVRARGRHGLGQLEVENGSDLDSVVKLVSASVPRKVFWEVYARAHDSETVKGVHAGSYLLRFALGRNWDGQRFSQDSQFYEVGDPLEFHETNVEDAESGGSRIKYAFHHVTLNLVFDGNTLRNEIDAATFSEGELEDEGG